MIKAEMMTLEAQKAFWPKALLVLSIVLFIGYLFFQRFEFLLDSQKTTCVQGSRLFLIDKGDRTPQLNAIFAFRSPNLYPYYAENTTFAKFLMAKPGDKITIDSESKILINDEVTIFQGLPHAVSKLNTPEKNFQGTRVLRPDEYWMMGDSPKSFDSRYWGPISANRIIGRVYKVL